MILQAQKEMDKLLDRLKAEGRRPSLLLQSCCGPCSSYVLEYLATCFDITIYYYNPNIYPESEYDKRLSEQLRLIREMSFPTPIRVLPAVYDPAVFSAAVVGHENAPEGGSRCSRCFVLRLEETAKAAKTGGFDYFATTLTVSPHKNAKLINEIGTKLGEKYGISYLPSDFKKKEGYKRSIQLSKAFNLYRQTYCGCKYSIPAPEPEDINTSL